MKSINKTIVKVTLLIVCMFFSIQSFSQSSQIISTEKAFERGINAYNNDRFTEAFPDLLQAAEAGISEAYGPLINLYADGDYDGSGKGNYKQAFSWVLMAQQKYLGGDKNQKLAVIYLTNYAPLCFLVGDYQETIDAVTKGYKMGFPKIPYVMAQVAASCLKLGKISKANEWLNNAMSLAKEKNDMLSFHAINAIRSKIALDKKDYSHALELSKDAATEGKIPLAAYVYGVALTETKNRPEIGKKWVKAAAEYDYYGIFEINCFEDEIKQYWKTIKNLSF